MYLFTFIIKIIMQEYFFDSAKPRRWDYSVHEVTDQPALSLVEDIIREKICIHTEKEIPYVVKQVRERNDILKN